MSIEDQKRLAHVVPRLPDLTGQSLVVGRGGDSAPGSMPPAGTHPTAPPRRSHSPRQPRSPRGSYSPGPYGRDLGPRSSTAEAYMLAKAHKARAIETLTAASAATASTAPRSTGGGRGGRAMQRLASEEVVAAAAAVAALAAAAAAELPPPVPQIEATATLARLAGSLAPPQPSLAMHAKPVVHHAVLHLPGVARPHSGAAAPGHLRQTSPLQDAHHAHHGHAHHQQHRAQPAASEAGPSLAFGSNAHAPNPAHYPATHSYHPHLGARAHPDARADAILASLVRERPLMLADLNKSVVGSEAAARPAGQAPHDRCARPRRHQVAVFTLFMPSAETFVAVSLHPT